ncbi:MAG: ATP-binding protein [candidate division WOR-3 bacterium]|nr:ATP-binding protein [candidate division WOR-3 bacterium]
MIIENSIDAIKETGKITISTDLSELDFYLNQDKSQKVMPKQYLKITIQDNGIGIPKRYLDKVFDPYFSYNKPNGSGLGLSLAKKIIEDHQGIIELTSEENIGTKVNIYLLV